MTFSTKNTVKNIVLNYYYLFRHNAKVKILFRKQ